MSPAMIDSVWLPGTRLVEDGDESAPFLTLFLSTSINDPLIPISSPLHHTNDPWPLLQYVLATGRSHTRRCPENRRDSHGGFRRQCHAPSAISHPLRARGPQGGHSNQDNSRYPGSPDYCTCGEGPGHTETAYCRGSHSIRQMVASCPAGRGLHGGTVDLARGNGPRHLGHLDKEDGGCAGESNGW